MLITKKKQGCKGITNKGLDYFFQDLPSDLKEFDLNLIKSSIKLTDEAFDHLKQSLFINSVEKFSFAYSCDTMKNYSLYTHDVLLKISQCYMPCLKYLSLDLKDCISIKSDSLDIMAYELPSQLKHLQINIDNCEDINDENLNHFLKNIKPSLTGLTLFGRKSLYQLLQEEDK
ncbi:hypothetical protein PPERSA_01172 [Pseudocohnilembus persalinus]|uniref:Uncharacterized protein n=1 Tax=Pseudocohnilembus persalinus TaxID=266149 RepID=A0A0V0R128_PSEPJ|nr:hypothetical protein PPERSA_01172 [Pseudocohnilembus persalinus]|eukprot:KRX08242.1 hypothetical protein PPERSA_01172 [Pseudocohnilembus persalinus]